MVLLLAGWAGLPLLIIAPVLAVILISIIVSVCTGRRNIPGAMPAATVVTFIAFVGLGIALFDFGTVPMIWVEPGFELVHVLVAVPAALTLGLFLVTWRLRVVGVVGIALLIGVLVVITTSNGQHVSSWQAEREALDAQQAAAQEDANFEAYIQSGTFPIVADLPGGTIFGVVSDGGPPRTLSTTVDGGVVEVVIDRNPIPTNPETTPCWYISAPNMGLEPTDTMQDYAAWCVQEGGLWRLTDGTGYARMEGDSVIATTSASTENVHLAGGARPASPEEVLEAWDSLRLMTEAEVRKSRE
ncbi:hypothetical protein L1277_000796 [Okibacterium sp. HSC-33S16]|uniref:hypothetical protein n=1 Tax=Okibacterium sp. HSC-33S16 TaxID=2910965 RepID=UPI00209D12C6|nr:hypothetical protein [Okibacterium sp. HSC-33S16]MCP2030732.1 hypothetical protein [Okibacterium sp. HSC-33S16]